MVRTPLNRPAVRCLKAAISFAERIKRYQIDCDIVRGLFVNPEPQTDGNVEQKSNWERYGNRSPNCSIAAKFAAKSAAIVISGALPDHSGGRHINPLNLADWLG